MRRPVVIVGVIVVIALAVGAVMYMNNSRSSEEANEYASPAASSSPAASAGSSTAEKPVTVTYDGQAFSPASVSVKAGNSITFKNDSSRTVQVDSDPHPVHTSDSELNVGTIEPGQSTTVTLTKKGSFGIHNHLSPLQKGQVTVE